jgi:hypothetical protein
MDDRLKLRCCKKKVIAGVCRAVGFCGPRSAKRFLERIWNEDVDVAGADLTGGAAYLAHLHALHAA